ncbi:hexosaminidase D [Lethenteron reissneri]|uniref:hexosaminidase D n=1 Tax=Lethenteron reissneri TaxID=7753 RepID=UPI002AB5E9C7|nr:hexosaminidase D [Lethenteron reissneri]
MMRSKYVCTLRVLLLAFALLAASKLIADSRKGHRPAVPGSVLTRLWGPAPSPSGPLAVRFWGKPSLVDKFWGKKVSQDEKATTGAAAGDGEQQEKPGEVPHAMDDRRDPGGAAGAAAAAAPPAEEKEEEAREHSPVGMRLVHLDLKGAAPQIGYLEQLIPYLTTLGADGLLVEYEDSFPYEGELQLLSSQYAYSMEDIRKMLQLAEACGLEVIPLVQTFGHMEFVLKHEKYEGLREVPRYPNSLNPHRAGALELLSAMVTQILLAHPRARYLHIGCDEVYHLGESPESKEWLSQNGSHLGRMFLGHLAVVTQHVREQRPEARVLVWDDMLSGIDEAALKESGIAGDVEPMLWGYSPNLNVQQKVEHVHKYANSGFKAVWFASAFKGASGPSTMVAPVKHHVDNQLRWLEVARGMAGQPIALQGIALTGWQRYDHYSVLCELLPVAIPSLAASLQTLIHGGFTDEAKKSTTELLGFQSLTDAAQFTWEGSGTFPGYEIYRDVTWISANLRSSVAEVLEKNEFLKGWFSPYHRKHKFGNPLYMEHFGQKTSQVHDGLEEIVGRLRVEMERVFFPDAVEEWLDEHVNPEMQPLRALVNDFKEIIALRARPKS